MTRILKLRTGSPFELTTLPLIAPPVMSSISLGASSVNSSTSRRSE